MPSKERTKRQLESASGSPTNVDSQSQHDRQKNRKKAKKSYKKGYWFKVGLEPYKALREYLGHEDQEVI